MYEIGTSPYFTNVAPGEVTDLPSEATPHESPDGYNEANVAGRPVYNDGQQVQYPPYEPEGENIEVHPVQYQPHQPDNQEVVVVDDTDINVDGESTGERLKLSNTSVILYHWKNAWCSSQSWKIIAT